VWRLERAERAAVLIDAASYYGALREALIKARSSVFIVGWDLDSRTRLVGESGRPVDGYPDTLASFLSALVCERPRLVVHLLVWDHSMLYALEREPFATVSLGWRTPSRIRYCLDDDLPVGASHHQKLVVVDDAVAFCGGLDLTIRRWDTPDHRLDDPRRVDPSGARYQPFHDVQAVVDGKAAAALAELVRERWVRAACTAAAPIKPTGDPWPGRVVPDFTGVEVGIARTLPITEESDEVREIERLFFDAIDNARRAIYIENQFLTATRIAERLAKRMREQPALEVVLVAPKVHHSWLESQVMRTGRLRFMQVLQAAGILDRVALLSPRVSNGTFDADIMVHSKLMIVDDILLHVGSANLNNRSIGLDTECNLAIEAVTREQRRSVEGIRDRLLGHHCGVGAQEVADSLASTRSLLKTALSLRGRGHHLEPIDEGGIAAPAQSVLTSLADPERPVPAPAFLQSVVGRHPQPGPLRRAARIVGLGVLVAVLMLLWQLTPLSELAQPEVVRQWLSWIAHAPGAPVIVVGVFVAGGLVAFPVLLLIAATAAAFGPWLGLAYASAGALASAIVAYGVGAAIGRNTLENVFGPRLNRIRRAVVKRGMLAVAAIRLVPIAPFTVVNMAAGACNIRFSDYVLGTILGMIPGITMMSLLGYQVWSIVTNPTSANVLTFLAAVAGWIALTLAGQGMILRWRRREI
jgi:phosphatidylserine/phosphatidylglycerophosphate/cardiolipin synthase-like enzyme/uncharacterized membrane protein YdjX (TVP38/TMEM64 family)